MTGGVGTQTLRGRIRALAGSLAALLLCCAVPAQAQISIEQLELRFSPSTGAAQNLPKSFRINNVSDAAVQVTIRLADWDRSITGENRYYAPGSQPNSCAKALTVFPMTLRIEAGRAEDVNVSVAAEAAAPCRSLLFVEMPPPPVTARSGANMTYNMRYGIKVYHEPALAPTGEIVEASVRSVVSDSLRTDTLEAFFRNTGLVQAIGRGHVEVRREDDSVAARVAVEDFPVLGGAVRRLDVALPKLAPGRYAVILFVDLGTDELLAAQALLEIP
jgi:P pilus assembly chaperone PapD